MKLCSIYQDIISFQLDAGKSLPGWLKYHCANCEDCRAYRHEQTALISRLESDANISMESPPPFLHGKIMSAIRRGEPAPEVRTAMPRPVAWLGFAGVAAALVLSFTLFRSEPDPGPEAADVSDNFSNIYTVAKMKPLEEWEIDLDGPLQDEMNRAISDAKTALNALADTFLSEEMKESLLVASQN